MGIEQHRDRVIGRIQQSIKQSGVDISAIPADQQYRLISTVADGMLLEVDAILDTLHEGASTPVRVMDLDDMIPPPLPDEEVVWQGRPLLSISDRYIVTTERIRLVSGLLSKTSENIELIRLQDIDYTQGLSERILGIGDIVLRSADASDPVAVLNNVKDPEQISGLIRKVWMEARRRHGLRFREEM